MSKIWPNEYNEINNDDFIGSGCWHCSSSGVICVEFRLRRQNGNVTDGRDDFQMRTVAEYSLSRVQSIWRGSSPWGLVEKMTKSDLKMELALYEIHVEVSRR